MVNGFRRLLIKFGKTIPFILCFVVFISYTESLIAVSTSDYMYYDGSITLSTPISFWIASRFEYDLLTMFAISVLSIAIETCIWNKLAILYLFIQLGEKSYFGSTELYPEYIISACVINIFICVLLCYKGFKIIISK